MITNFYLIEAKITGGDEFEKVMAPKITKEIMAKILRNGYIPPTQEWISGQLVSGRTDSNNRTLIRKLYRLDSMTNDQEKAAFRQHFPEHQEKTARNIKAIFDTLAKYRLIDPELDSSGRAMDYEFPDNSKAESVRRDKISKLRAQIKPILEKFYKSPLQKMKEGLSAQEYEAGKEYVKNLPDNLQHAFSVFMQMDAPELSYFKHLIKVREESKKDGYTKEVMDKLATSASADFLNALGVITEKGVLNLPLVNNIIKLLSDENFVYKTRDLAPEFYNTLKRISSGRTYAENAFAKKTTGTTASLDAAGYVENLNQEERNSILSLYSNANTNKTINISPNLLNKFKSDGLLDSGNKFTTKGTAVAIALRAGRGTLGAVKNDVESVTGRDPRTTMPNSPPQRDDKTYDTIGDRKDTQQAQVRSLAKSIAEPGTVARGSDSTTRPKRDISSFLKFREDKLKNRQSGQE